MLKIKKILSFNKQNKCIELLYKGSILLLSAMIVGLIAYFFHIKLFIYISFFFIVLSIILLYLSMLVDLRYIFKSSYFALLFILVLLILYFSLRLELHYFFFSVSDASDYYLAGVSSALNGDDIGFFLPLTSALSMIGFELFGHKYAPLIYVIVYVASIPLIYFILQKLIGNIILTSVILILSIISPLSILYSKTSFSEPIWQILLLHSILYSFYILKKEKISYLEYLPILLVLALAPFTRGESVLLYIFIVFLSLYHLWIFNNNKSSFIIASGLIILTLSNYLSLITREVYLLKIQYNRIFSNVTIEYLMIIFVIIIIVNILIILLSNKLREKFKHFNLYIITIIIILKPTIAYIFSIKNDILFSQLFFFNEYELALSSFGLPLVVLMITGMIMMYYQAIKGDKLSLILLVVYILFYIPFTMQNPVANREHEFFLYWHRYYFSILMIVHLFALSISLKIIYIRFKMIKVRYIYKAFVFYCLLFLLIFYSLNTALSYTVITEPYLKGSSKLSSWLKKRVKDESVAILYDSDVRFANYTVQKFMSRGLEKVMNIKVSYYFQVKKANLNPKLELNSNLYKSPYLLCISTKPCIFEDNRLLLIDSVYITTSWLRQKKNTFESEKKFIKMYVYLFKVS